MALETVTHLDDLVPTNPAPTDPASQGDDHIRNIKAALRNSLPNISGAVTATHTELNHMVGANSPIQEQINEGAEALTSIFETPFEGGNGVIVSGEMGEGFAFGLAPPRSISATSTNSADATGHSHAFDEAGFRSMFLKVSETYGPGTYMLLQHRREGGDLPTGSLIAGSLLRPVTIQGFTTNTVTTLGMNVVMEGTWKSHGPVRGNGGGDTGYSAGIYQRVL